MAMPSPEVLETAREAGLRYTTDDSPGITRVRAGRGFRYVGPDGVPVGGDAELKRIRRLAIPPAWTHVWICPDARGHIQATGRDAKGRKQYRYHERFRETRDEDKYARMADFARALPKIRARVDADLRHSGLPRERVLATVVRLLERSFIRVGNEEYAKENDSYGLTTLRGRHVRTAGPRVRFHFRGKSGKEHDVELRDPRVARVVRALQDLPGQQLFRYVDDDGVVRAIDSDDVNAYLREIAGDEFTAKDFRTWGGTLLASRTLARVERAANVRYAKRAVAAAVKEVAARLGNTPAICRKCYIHPSVIDGFLAGAELPTDEAGVLRFLGRRRPQARQAA